MSPSSKYVYAREERGAVIVLAVVLTVSMLAVGALAFDGARMYYTRMCLQKIADTAALAIVGFTIHEGPSQAAALLGGRTNLQSVVDSDLQPFANQVVNANIRELGWGTIASSRIVVTPRVVPPDVAVPDQVFRVEVKLDMPMRFLLMDKIPLELLGTTHVFGETMVTASARSGRRVANASLLLDASRSMACPAFTDCSCLSPTRTASCQAPLKVDILAQALQAFIRRFDLNRDRIQFVPFQLVGRPYTVSQLVTMANTQIPALAIPLPPNLPADPTLVDVIINQLVTALLTRHSPLGNTNICDALLEAEPALQAAVPSPTSLKAYILFTDGAPTAMTFDSANFTSLAESQPGTGQHRYVHYSLDWRNSTGNWTGPSALGNRESFRTLAEMGLGYNAVDPPPGSAPSCGPSASPAPANGTPSEISRVANQVFAGCMRNLGFRLPNGRNAANASIPYAGGTQPDDPSFADWQKQYYNCAVQQADLMRLANSTFYVIGLGNAASATDCYQNVNDTQSRKDYFLSRLANDYYFGRVRASHAECQFSNGSSYAGWQSQSNPHEGEYYPIAQTDDLAARLAEVYEQIAIKLLLSLLG